MGQGVSNYLNKHSDENKILRKVSVKQVSTLIGVYKSHFRDAIDNPTADTNHILNYYLKLHNFYVMNNVIFMVAAGMGTFGVKSLFGATIDRVTMNYLSQKNAMLVQIPIYVVVYFYLNNWMDSREIHDINYLVQPNNFNGEIMLNIAATHIPAKVDLTLYQ